jgi:hypothetical protein
MTRRAPKAESAPVAETPPVVAPVESATFAPVSEAFTIDLDAVAELAAEAPPEPPPLALRMPIRVRIGGTDEAPVWRAAEVVKIDGYGISALIYLDGQHDPGLSCAVKQRGHPARSGECLVLPNATEGSNVGQWSRLS